MESIINEQKPQPKSPSPAFRTLEQKIDELVNGIRGIQDIIWDRRKTIKQQVKEIIQLAQDLSIDEMQLRDMIYESCTRIGVSPSWLRKMLPKNLKLSKHTRKDYLKLQQQRDQQPLQKQPQQQQKELVELPTSSSSRHPAVEQQQDEEGIITTVTTCDNIDNNVSVISKTQNEQIAILEGKDTIIKNLEKKIEELQEEIRYLHDGSSAQRQQPQEEETFTALGYLQLFDNDVPIKVTVNVKTKSIECMKVDRELIKKVMKMTSYEKTTP
jgi:hypothetical protein